MLGVRDSIQSMKERLASRKEQFDRAAVLQARVLTGEKTDVQPLLLSTAANLSQYPAFNPKQTHYDPEKMLCQELRGAVCAAEAGRESVPSVRANMGCGIVLSLMGLKQELYDDKMPWLQKHLSREEAMEMQPSDLKITPEFEMAMQHMEYMAEELKGTGVRVYPLDIQGAIDTAHLLIGDDMFYEVYDDEEYMDHVLELSTAAIIMAMEECLKRIPGSDEYVGHYSSFCLPRHFGPLKLSEDTTTLLSRAHIWRYAQPYTRRILEHFGGGYVHYCGKNDHLLDMTLEEPLCRGLNFGNPDKHDMEEVVGRCARAKKCFMGICSVTKEDAKPYFEKMLRASEYEGRNWLLMQYSCPADQVSEVSAIWDAAVSQQRSVK